jgi:hypothetical protein
MNIEHNLIFALFALLGVSIVIFPSQWGGLLKAWHVNPTVEPPRDSIVRAMGVVWLVIVASFYF